MSDLFQKSIKFNKEYRIKFHHHIMKNNLLVLFTFFLTIILFYSCQQDACLSKDQFFSSFETFIDEIEKSKDNLTDEQKIAFEDRYRNIVNNCYKKYKDQLDLDEKQDFWIKSVKSYLKLHDGNINVFLKDDEDDPFNQYVQNEIEELIEESGDDFSTLISDLIKDEIPNIIDMFIDGLGKFNEELKEKLDK